MARPSKTGIKGLVFDMRNNPGGLLSSAVQIADLFIDDGLIVTIRPRVGQEQAYGGEPGGYLNFPAGPPCSGSTVNQLCLQGRFLITTTFRTATTPGPSDGTAHVVFAGPNSGVFWFFSSDNWEVMVKAINACSTLPASIW